jgi:hypothetical protein
MGSGKVICTWVVVDIIVVNFSSDLFVHLLLPTTQDVDMSAKTCLCLLECVQLQRPFFKNAALLCSYCQWCPEMCSPIGQLSLSQQSGRDLLGQLLKLTGGDFEFGFLRAECLGFECLDHLRGR